MYSVGSLSGEASSLLVCAFLGEMERVLGAVGGWMTK